jgi:hypothetical protein
MKTYTLKLPADAVQVILNSLSEQPFKLVNGTIAVLMAQIKEQDREPIVVKDPTE